MKSKMESALRQGLDPRIALEPNDEFQVAALCKRCGRHTVSTMQGLEPDAHPKLAPYRCVEPDPSQPDGRCGGEV